MQKKNNTATFWRRLRVSLFPIRENWRFWIGFVGPLILAACWPWLIEPTLLNLGLFIAFQLTVIQAFRRFMVKAQIRVDSRRRRREWFDGVMSEIEKLEQDYAAIRAMLDELPPEVRAEHDERVKRHEAHIAALYQLLGELPK